MKQYSADTFYAIADASRREILNLLTKNDLTINSLAGNFNMSRPAVSKHIKILYSAGFISIEDIGRERYCKLKKDGFNELQSWIDYYQRFWNQKLGALEKFLSHTNIQTKKNKSIKKKPNEKR